jgi:hypothetical protein
MFEEKKSRTVEFKTKPRPKKPKHFGPLRNLKSYKEQQQNLAEEKGCLEAFMAATTMTKAKKILFG